MISQRVQNYICVLYSGLVDILVVFYLIIMLLCNHMYSYYRVNRVEYYYGV